MNLSLTLLSTRHSDERVNQALWEALQKLHTLRDFQVILVNDLFAAWEVPAVDFPLECLNTAGMGQYQAILQGLTRCRSDIVIIFDPDYAAILDVLVDQLLSACALGFDWVLLRRLQRPGVAASRRWLSNSYNQLLRWMCALGVHDINSPVMALTATALRQLPDLPQGEVKLHLYDRLSGRVTEIAADAPQSPGRSSYSLWNLLPVLVARVLAVLQYFYYR